jgi:hypothetical protein
MKIDMSTPATGPVPRDVMGPPDEASFRRLLLPLDGSATAEAVLPFVRRLASPAGRVVHVVQAVPPTPVVAMEVATPDVIEVDVCGPGGSAALHQRRGGTAPR